MTKAISTPLTKSLTARALATAINNSVTYGAGEQIKEIVTKKVAEELAVEGDGKFGYTFTEDFVVTAARKTSTKGLEVFATKTSTNLLSQFTKSTIDDAVNLVMKNSNDIKHIYAGKHNLGSLVNKLGGQENAIRAVLNAGNGRFPASGIFKNLSVPIY